MKVYNLKDFKGGWILGNFEPSAQRIDSFEVGFMVHTSGQYHAPHYHRYCTEYNVVLDGKLRFKDEIVSSGQMFIFEKNEIAYPEFLTDCRVLVIKAPSVPGDKIYV